MRAVRRLLQVVALVGTLLVGVVALALIVSQTPWFRDWMRRYIVRESKQYLNGELSVGGLGGNLLFGVQVNDVALDMSGERVVAVRALEVDYSIFEIIASGVVLNEIKLVEPYVKLEKNADGWNLGRLVKEQEQEAEREGPGTPITLESILIQNGQVVIEDEIGTSGYELPEQVNNLNLDASFAYAPVHYSVVVNSASLTTTAPDFTLSKLAGKVAVRDDNVYVDGLTLRTGESALDVDGVVENYLEQPVLKLTTTGHVSLPEIGRLVPAASGYPLRPKFDIKATGPARALQLDLDVATEAGSVDGAVTADVAGPDLGMRGALEVNGLNLAPILKDPAQKSDITGKAQLDLQIAGSPEAAPVTDRMTGTFAFSGPTLSAAGYSARDVRVTGSFKEARINLDARANAYGGTATAKGYIVPPAEGRELSFELRGAADDVDLSGLPASTGAPALDSNLSVAEYRIAGDGKAISGTARLNASTVEGATLAQGTTAEFGTDPGGLTFSARGSVSDLNLSRIGGAMEIDALAKPAYDGDVNGRFDISGSLPPPPRGKAEESALTRLDLQAKGTLENSSIMGGRLPSMAYEAALAKGSLSIRADGSFEGFNPATLAERKDLEGSVSGTVDLTAQVEDLTGSITAQSITADGTVALEDSKVGGLQIDGATVTGRYAGEVADLKQLSVSGPDLKVDAAGRLALNQTGTSDLKYHVEAVDLAGLAGLAGQEGVSGSAVLDGVLTGNAASLQTTGTLDGSNLGYGENTALDLNSTYSVTVPELTFGKASVEADTKATFVKAGGLEINTLTAQTAYEGDRLTFDTTIQEETRQLQARGDVVLHTDHQEIHLPELALRTQGIEWRTAADQPATPAEAQALGNVPTIKYGRDRVELENVRLVSGNQVLDLSGTFALKGDPSGTLDVKAQNIDLQQLETLMLTDRGLAGTLSADATVSGTAEKPVVDGHVEIRNGAFQTYTYESLTADVDYSGTTIGLDATLQQSATEAFTAKGTLPMSLFEEGPGGHVAETPEDRIDLRVQSTDLGLGFVQGFTDAITNVTGTLKADVRVTGSGQDPHVTGFVDIKNGAFGVPMGGVSYTGLDTRIDLEEDRVKIRKFSIVDEEGQPLTVAGELAVHAREVGAVNINIGSDNFEIIDNQLGDVGIESDITITGELTRPVIKGTVRLEAARLEVDELLSMFYDPYAVEELPPVVSAERSIEGAGSAEQATQQALRRAPARAAGPAPAPGEAPKEAEAGEASAEAAAAEGGAFAPVTLDLRLVIPDNLVLRGNDLRPGGPTGASVGDMNITVGGDLEIRKEPGGPVLILGTVRTVRGTYEFQGRRFNLARGGTMRFMGEPQPNPSLDITATRQIPNTGVEAQIRIQGTAQQPELSLSSTPPLEESDILALIVFNRPINELGSGERVSLAATAGGIATGFIAAPLGESIGRALDLDLFEITTTTEEGDFGAGLTVGQQIGDDVYFKLRQQFGERSITEFLLEYQLTDFLRVQATAAPETTGAANRIGQRRIERAGIDLIFFFSY